MPDTELLAMALVGYETERQKIQAKIVELQRLMRVRNHRAGTAVPARHAKRARRRMSAAARRRIAAAQKKRWAEYRKKHQTA